MSYFYGSTAAQTYSMKCSYSNIIANNGSVVENNDGTVSVYTTNGPMALNKYCCEVLKVGYTFNVDTQKCMWSSQALATPNFQSTTQAASQTCDLNSFKLTLNPNGNDGSIFYVDDNNETCSLNIEFDYLIKVSCESLTSILNGASKSSSITSAVQSVQLLSNTQSVECNALKTKIDTLTKKISETSYSIVCSYITPQSPYNSQVPIDSLTPFNNTGFNAYSFDLENYSTETLCLTDNGLTEWSKILGTRYNSFIGGDPNSYTCNDFNKLKEKNIANLANNKPELAFTCTTPFGTKSALLIELKTLQTQYDECVAASATTSNQLTQLQTIVTTENNTCGTPIDTFENLDISLTLDYVGDNQQLVTVATYPLLTPIGTGNLYDYLSTNQDSGFLVCGESNSTEISQGITGCTPIYLDSNPSNNVFVCSGLITNLLDGLFNQSTLDRTIFDTTFNKNALASKWLHYQSLVDDTNILNEIANKNIKITIQVNSSCGDFCILLDNIKLNKVCSLVSENKMFISNSPGFDLTRVIDNKKSWVANTTTQNRPFGITNVGNTNPIRQTNYDVNDERLIINTKEIDLDISIASGIENDVWCYISDNPCLLTATTIPTDCGCSTLPCFKDSFNIIDLKDATGIGYFEDVFSLIRQHRNAWLKSYNERDLAVGPYFTIKDSPYSPIYNEELVNNYNSTRDAYNKANRELSVLNFGYIYDFNDKPNETQFFDSPIPQIVKTDCGDVMCLGASEFRLYFVSNQSDELEIYFQDTSGVIYPSQTLVNYTPLINDGNVDSVYVGEYSGTPQLFCTTFGNYINIYSDFNKSKINYEVNSNVNTLSNGAMNTSDLLYIRWDSTKNKCMARNTKAFPEAFSVNFLKQDYIKFCNRYDEGDYNECLANATGDITYANSSVLVTTFTGDTTYTTLGNYIISGISDTSLINVGSYIIGDGVTYNSRVVSKTSDSITVDYINTITATGVTLQNWSDALSIEGDLKSSYYRRFRDSNLSLSLNTSLFRQQYYVTSITDSNGNIPNEPMTGLTAPYYAFVPIDVTTTIRKGSVNGDIVYKESYRLNDPSATSAAGQPSSYVSTVGNGLANVTIPIGIAYTGGFQYNTNPLSTDYSTYSNEIPYGTYISGSTAGLPFFDSGNNTSDAIDYVNEYYVHLDIIDTSGNTYYATNNDFNLKDSNLLIKFPTTASTQTFDINSFIISVDNKKQEFLDARDNALNIIVKNGGCVNC